MTTLVIAEAGVNHNGDVAAALRLVDAAAAAGADIVKFQTFTAARLATAQAAKAAYQSTLTGDGESQRTMLGRLELSADDHRVIVTRCEERDIEFLSTGFDIESVDLLVGLGIRRMKIPSGEITNLPYLRHLGGLGLPIILSTGMSTIADVAAALTALSDAGTSSSAITVLHCTTAYPAPIADVNLAAMVTLRDTFGVAVGYSDHTLGAEVAVAAVALGATVIEKHITLDSSAPGPDHAASMEPADFAHLVRMIRNIEIAIGDGVKIPRPSEEVNMTAARKSIVAAVPIAAGEPFTAANLTAKRPGTGISPMRWDDVIGSLATRHYSVDERIEP